MTEQESYFWLERTCHDCGAKVGELHELGCDMERCPLCNPVNEMQLISCRLGHFETVEKGESPRIPYIPRMFNCETCNELFPKMFNVPDEEWDKYVIPTLQHKVLCWDCYVEMKGLFPNGWRNSFRTMQSDPMKKDEK